MTAAAPALPVLVYDGDCAFCSTSVRWLESLFPGSFEAVPYQYADLGALGLDARACHERVQWVDAVTSRLARHETGARAVGDLLRRGGADRGGVLGAVSRGLGGLARTRPTSWLAEGVYLLVAANRRRLPGGTPTCGL
ncbi:MAG TPA: DCC1-like thiol-disulfide oxidoreductase family protein [Candidatus Angelobacter sp.]|nr:DCC1-like thiol-disulfide oxidoreductase family protein [Candidatus Angelobacter sp.]